MKHLVIPAILILIGAYLATNSSLTGSSVDQTFLKSKPVSGTEPGYEKFLPYEPSTSILPYFAARQGEQYKPSIEMYNALVEQGYADVYPIGNPDGQLTRQDAEVISKIIQRLGVPAFANKIGIRPSRYDQPGSLTYSANSFDDINELTIYGLPSEGNLWYLDVWSPLYNPATGEYRFGDGNLNTKDISFIYDTILTYGPVSTSFVPKSNDCSPDDEGKIFPSPGLTLTRGSREAEYGEPWICVQEGSRYTFRPYSQVYGEPFPDDKEVVGNRIQEKAAVDRSNINADVYSN